MTFSRANGNAHVNTLKFVFSLLYILKERFLAIMSTVDNMQNTLTKLCSCLLLFGFTITATLFAEKSKSLGGEYPYNTFMIPFAVEGCKLVVSTVLLMSQYMRDSSSVVTTFSARGFGLFAVPAFCYFVSNNCMFYIIHDLGPSTFQVTNNLKVLSTGLLMHIFLGRKLSWLKWKALIILAIGSMVTQLQADLVDDDDKKVMRVTTRTSRSYLIVCVNAFAAGAGGVFSEKLLKSVDTKGNASDSIHWQNMQLYLFGLLFGLLSLYTNQAEVSIQIFAGFNAYAYATVATLTICGLLVSFILKYIDNLAKCFVAALSMISIVFIETSMKHETIPLRLILGVILTCLALEQYNMSA